MEMEKRTRIPLITMLFVAANVIVFLISDLILFHRQDEIVYYMALNPTFVLDGGEYRRLFTSMFYHFGIEHLTSNMLMLFAMGTVLEPFFGRLRFTVLYVASGLIGSVVSVLYNGVLLGGENRFVFCAGASGAVYGLIGAFTAIFLLQRRKMPESEKRRLLLAVVFLLFGSIYDTGVGHDAHFGGFAAGLLLGLCFCILRKREQR